MQLILKKIKAMSLIEILVAVFLVSFISLLMAQLTSNSIKSYKKTQLANRYDENISKIIRDFEFTTRAGINVEVAKPLELVFYRYYDSDSAHPTKIKYYVENLDDKYSFKITKYKYSGVLDGNNLPIYDEGETVLIVEELFFESQPPSIFNYYNSDGDQIICDTTLCSDDDVINKRAIRSVSIKVTLGGNPIDINKKTTQGTKIKFRNINET